MVLLRTATNVYTLLLVGKMLLSVGEIWFRMYITDTLWSVNGRYVGQFLYDGYIGVLGERTENYELCEEMEQGKVVGRIN